MRAVVVVLGALCEDALLVGHGRNVQVLQIGKRPGALRLPDVEPLVQHRHAERAVAHQDVEIEGHHRIRIARVEPMPHEPLQLGLGNPPIPDANLRALDELSLQRPSLRGVRVVELPACLQVMAIAREAGHRWRARSGLQARDDEEVPASAPAASREVA